ncbi:unnamed protein product, partial [Closterium sp. NIES-54]
TTLTPLPELVPICLADPSGGPVVARSSIVLPCLVFPPGSLSGLHLPSFSTNLVSTAALQDAMVTTTTLGGQRVSICTCTRMGRHLATFTRRPGSSLYTLATEPPQVAASAQVSASSQVAASCSCCLLSHQTLLWHHRVGHPSLPRLRGMHSRLLVSGLPRSLPPLPPSPAPPCLPCVEGRQRAAPHSSSFPPTTAPLQTLHMDRFGQDLPVLRLHSDRGGDFSSSLLRDFCRAEGILQSFTLPDSPQKNGIAERRIGLFMEVARTSMIHAAAPNFLWPFARRRGHGDHARGGIIAVMDLKLVIEVVEVEIAEVAEVEAIEQLREWFVLRARLRNGATGAGGAGDARAGGAGVTARNPDPTEPGTAGVGGNGAGGAGAGVAGPTRAGAVDPGAGGARDTVRPRQYFVSLLQQPASPLPAPSPYSEQSGSLTEDCEPASRPVSPVRSAHLVPCSRPPPVLGTHAMAFRPSSVPLRVPLPPPSESSLPKVPNPQSDRARAARPTIACLLATAVTDPSFESTVASTLVAELLDFAAA